MRHFLLFGAVAALAVVWREVQASQQTPRPRDGRVPFWAIIGVGVAWLAAFVTLFVTSPNAVPDWSHFAPATLVAQGLLAEVGRAVNEDAAVLVGGVDELEGSAGADIRRRTKPRAPGRGGYQNIRAGPSWARRDAQMTPAAPRAPPSPSGGPVAPPPPPLPPTA